MIVVSNTGPLIALLKAGQIELLKELFGHVLVPPKVREEILQGENQAETNEFLNLPWIQVQKLNIIPERMLQKELDDGEAEVIQLAIEAKADLVILDERKARRICQLVYQLPLKGTAGILVAAKRKQIIHAVKPILQKMRQNGYYLSDRLISATLAACNELEE